MMNRIIARRDFVKMGLLAGATVATGGLLSACASNGEGAASQSADGLGGGSSSGANQAVQADPATPPQPVGGKVLVAYFSALGHTRAVAERIAAATGAPVVPIFVTRNKTPFCPIDVIVGRPHEVCCAADAPHERLQQEADDVLRTIYRMGGDSYADHIGENSGLLLRS